MTLVELQAHFVRYSTTEGRDYVEEVPDLASAQGVFFLCPLCYAKAGSDIGVHGIEVAFQGRGVLDHQGSQNSAGKPSRWNVSGTGLHDLTLAPSIAIGGCGWHSYVRDGAIV